MKAVQRSHAAHEIARAGNLRETPFATLLIALLDSQKHGTLRVIDERQELQSRVLFQQGLPVATRTQDPSASLIKSLIPLCTRADGDYLFVEDCDEVGSGSDVVRGRVDPLALITAVMRGPVREDAVNAALTELGNELLRLHPRIQIERYGFTQQERDVAVLLQRTPMAMSQLVSCAPERVVRRVVYVLAITRGVGVAGRRLVSGTIARIQPPPAAADAEIEIELDLDAEAEPQVQPPADATVVTRFPTPKLVAASKASAQADPNAAGRYHFIAPEEGETVVPQNAKAADAASQVLKAAPSHAQRAVEAELNYREAERLMKRSDYPAALRQAHQAMRMEGTARHEALYAWLLALRSAPGAAIHPRAFQHVDNALRREPNCEQAHYYKGAMFKRSGDLDAATSHFKRVLRLNPAHQDAARELRVLEMRQRTRGPSDLFGKLFKRPPANTKRND